MNLKKLNLILSCILIFLIAIILSYNIALIYKNNHFSVKVTEYKNVYELKDKSWFILDRENNKYIFQPIELGDYDYTLKSEKNLKNIIATYFINKYKMSEEKAIENVEKIFENL